MKGEDAKLPAAGISPKPWPGKGAVEKGVTYRHSVESVGPKPVGCTRRTPRRKLGDDLLMRRVNHKEDAAYVYFDTSIWNVLCDQAVDAQQLVADLSERGFQISLGTNAVYEMAKTFKMPTPDAIERGQKLFSYLKQYTDRSIPCIRETWDLVEREAAHAAGESPTVDVLWNPEEYSALLDEVEKPRRWRVR